MLLRLKRIDLNTYFLKKMFIEKNNMSVKIELGHGLDGGITKTPQSTQGMMTLGPLRLLSWLETRLGVELPEVSFTARMLQYLKCLKECDTIQRFYHESLQQDELGVARELLQRRDQWYEAGWDGGAFTVDASNRLRDLVEVENLASEYVAPGMGQRIQRVLAALTGLSTDISLVLLDPPDTFSTVWQQVFSILNADVQPHALSVNGTPDSDLARLQAALLNTKTGEEKIALSGDGSFIVLRDGSTHLSSHWVARYAQQFVNIAGSDTAAILSESGGSVFDAAREEGHLPRLGFAESSSWRPVFQVLPLALELLWEPLDPVILLQFLSHPMGPLPGQIRARLAKAVADEPGIGGANWQNAVSESLDGAVSELEPGLAKKRHEENIISTSYHAVDILD
jgi:ATP-dependent helicase/nuclease subunit B